MSSDPLATWLGRNGGSSTLATVILALTKTDQDGHGLSGAELGKMSGKVLHPHEPAHRDRRVTVIHSCLE